MIDIIRSEPLAVFVLIGIATGAISCLIAILYGATHEPRVLCDPELPDDDRLLMLGKGNGK